MDFYIEKRTTLAQKNEICSKKKKKEDKKKREKRKEGENRVKTNP